MTEIPEGGDQMTKRESRLPFFALRTLLQHSAEPIFLKDIRLRYTGASPAFARLMGTEEPAALCGKTDVDLFEAELAARYMAEDRRLLRTGKAAVSRIEPLPAWQGRRCFASISKYPIFDEGGLVLGLCGVCRDVTGRPEATEREWLLLRATTDTLTGLCNRETTLDRIGECLTGYGRNQWHALLFIDLDCFKQVNDTLGHAFGDSLLREAASRLREAFRRDDIVGRIGGDEFLVLLRNVGGEADIRERTDSLFRSMPFLCAHDGRRAGVTCSVGAAWYRGDGKPFARLCDEADRAMYRAKREGKNRIAFFNEAEDGGP